MYLVAAAWHHDRWNLYSADDVGRFASDVAHPVVVEGVAAHAPRWVPALPDDPHRAYRVGERTRVLLRVDALRDGNVWRAASGDAVLRVQGHLLGVRAGDRLRIFGQLRSPRSAANPGEFDAAAFARGDRRLAELSATHPDCVVIVARGSGIGFQRGIDAIRDAGDAAIWKFVGERHGGVARAVLLGAREGLTGSEIDPYLRTGTIHLLVVSGLHVGILAMALFAAMQFGWVGRGIAVSGIVLLVVGYALLADVRPPITRAATLTILACLAIATGRRIVAYNSLAAAGLIVLAINPCELFRTGPQLSFIAVATLIWYGSRVFLPLGNRDPLHRLGRESEPAAIRIVRTGLLGAAHIMAATAVVWLTALPLVMQQFHIVAPVAIAIAPLVWLVTWSTLLSGFALLSTGWVADAWATWCGWLCDRSLAALQAVVMVARDVPGGHFWTAGPAPWWVVGFYVGLAVPVLISCRVTVPPRWSLAGVAIWITVGLVPSLWSEESPDGLACSFVALGHGACVVIEMPGGATMLYDAGNLTSPEHGVRTIAPFLWSRGIESLDAIVLSHADIDHYNAVPGLLDRFAVGAVVVGPQMFDPGNVDDAIRDADPVAKLRQAIEGADSVALAVAAGQQIVVPGESVQIRVLHPPPGGIDGNDNANSLVLEIDYAGRRILLPGDLEAGGLDRLLAQPPRDCDVLLAPHHGSRHSDPAAVADWCRPEWVVISGGNVSGVEFARERFREAGGEVLRTAKSGLVRCTIDSAGTLQVEPFRP